MSLFPKAMLVAWKAYGDAHIGDEIQPLHIYNWMSEINGVQTDDATSFALWDYLSDEPLSGGWMTHDLTVADAIKEANMDFLYIGGGAGRFAKAALSWGLVGHCIDHSPDAIELMTLRGVPCDLMDGNDMSAYADNSWPLVVISPWSFSGSPDPTQILSEAARVAEQKVIVSDWQVSALPNPPLGTWPEPVDVRETIEWNGETEQRDGKAYHLNHVLSMLDDVGMVPDKSIQFLADLERLDIFSWLVEATHK